MVKVAEWSENCSSWLENAHPVSSSWTKSTVSAQVVWKAVAVAIATINRIVPSGELYTSDHILQKGVKRREWKVKLVCPSIYGGRKAGL